ncbi:MAG: 50S ribosomal protein L1 [Candidatus Paracaedibacteraceae bacterium]|nr:50S ribosomal protein L1 [Candidatus Paracaedibacteraceae bacterium]
MARIGKNLKKAYEGLNLDAVYALSDAVKNIKERSFAKFDETVEIALNLNLDVRKADQALRGMLTLPHGNGKMTRVCVFAKGPKAEEATKAGAEFVGGEELIDDITSGKIQFERCIATPDMMGVVGRLGKVLGPKGLMPNPKLGTVTMNVADAINAAKSGQIEYRADKAGIIHLGIGKVSFDAAKLVDNANLVISTLGKARPAGVKGSFVKKISMSSTMGASFKLDLVTLKEITG